MNFSRSKNPIGRVAFRQLLCWCFVMMTFSGFSQPRPTTAGRTNRPPTERFLVILEISSAMEKRAANVQPIINQMFSSGLNGQLHPGDTIGFWTYNDKLHTGEFPLQHWTPQSVREVTTVIALFAQKQKYSKRSRLAPVMAQLTNLVAASGKITVILISDGSESPVGTPFDTQIAAAFKLNGPAQRKQSMPFVTVLRAVKGEFVSFKVSAPPWAVEFPPFSAEPAPVAPAPTNPPALKVERPPPPSPVTPAVAQPTPATAETNPVLAISTNPPIVVEPAPTPTTTEPASNAISPAVEVARAPPATNMTPPPLAERTAPVTNSTAATATTAKPSRNLVSLPILAGAGIVLVGLAIFCLALLRRSHETPRVSLITRSMNKEGK